MACFGCVSGHNTWSGVAAIAMIATRMSTLGSATFYRRPLPQGLIPFASPQGRQLFQEALAEGGMEGWFALAEQFHTQSDPAFCGLGSLVVALNSLQIDPGRIWKGPWRWYSEELLDCCLPLDEVKSKGVTMEELACLARCNGARANLVHADAASASELREAIVKATGSPLGPIMIAAYTRRALGQTGDGHFSPVAGFHRAGDLVLVLDVARFKYPPHWLPLPLLHEAMQATDPASGRARGWIMLERDQHASALLFRLVNHEDAQALSARLFEAPDEITFETASDFARALDARLGEVASRWVSRALSDAQTLTPEHQLVVQELLSQLRGSEAFALVRRIREDAASARDEAVAMLLLSMPPELMGSLHAPRGLLEDHLQIDPAHSTLAREVVSLGEQLQTLCQWHKRGGARTCAVKG